MNPQPLEYVLGPEETMEILENGTEVSCKLVEVLINSGEGVVGMMAAVFGLAKATMFIDQLMLRKGYDMSGAYNDMIQLFGFLAQTEECQKTFDEYGL